MKSPAPTHARAKKAQGASKPHHAYRDLLRTRGLRATGPRVVVLELLEQRQKPMTHAEVAEALVDSGFDRATLYRNLVDMTDTGLLKRADHGDHVWRFELAARPGHPSDGHAHFICRGCGTVECLPSETVAIRPSKKSPKALRRSSVQVELRGLCDACS